MVLCLLTGTPGQAKSEIVAKVSSHLRDLGLSVGHGSVESHLLQLIPDAPLGRRDALVSLIGRSPPTQIREVWPAAYTAAFHEAAAEKPDVVIVTACLEYYCSQTFEFYSPVNVDKVKESNPANILTLIDDIYDVYYRLSQPGEVFDIQRLQEMEFSSTRRDMKDLRRLYKDALSLAIQSLLRVLVWREKEIEVASNLARAVNCESAVLATKHPVETGVRLLLGTDSSEFSVLGETYPAYVSHPITRPRKRRSETGKWPSFVGELGHVVHELRARSDGRPVVAPVMPTAIDEYRLLTDGVHVQPHLTPRWPLPEEELLYCQPAGPAERPFRDYDDFEARGIAELFDPPIDDSGRRLGLPLPDAEVSGILRVLQESVRLYMAGRDHRLVRQCPGFFLYRPTYETGRFSRGVTQELSTFSRLRRFECGSVPRINRRVAFLHDAVDVPALFAEKTDGSYPQIVQNVVGEVRRTADESAMSTSRHPKSAPDSVVSAALQKLGSLDDCVDKLHKDMFPRAATGSIEQDEEVDPQMTHDGVLTVLHEERTKALAGSVEGTFFYLYEPNGNVFEHGDAALGDTQVQVAAELGSDETRRSAAAARVREFFGRSDPDTSAPEGEESRAATEGRARAT